MTTIAIHPVVLRSSELRRLENRLETSATRLMKKESISKKGQACPGRVSMHVCAKRFMMAAILLAAPLWSQEVHHTDNSNLLARFAYENSTTQQENADRRICMAVSRSGDYRILRLHDDGQTVLREGKMQDEQFKQLQDLLSASEFRVLSGSHGGVIRSDAESFSAEVARGPDKAQRVQLLNADGGNPFPGSVKKIVDWLEHFQVRSGNSLDEAESADVCPSVGLRLLQPSVATNEPR